MDFYKDISEIIRNYAQAIQSVATVTAIIIGGIWAYFRFYKQREHSTRLEFTVDVEFVGLQDNRWLVEVVAFIENKGLVLHDIRNFVFDLRYLTNKDVLEDGEKNINFQTNIKHSCKKGSWIPEDWESTFIEPGLKTRYSYIANVPAAATFLLIHGKFNYRDQKEFHTADKLIKVPDKTETNKEEENK